MKIKLYSLVMIVSLLFGYSLAIASDNDDRERQLELEKNRKKSEAIKFMATNMPLVVRGLPLFGKAVAWTGSVLAVETYSQFHEAELERQYERSMRSRSIKNNVTFLNSTLPQGTRPLRLPSTSKPLDPPKPSSESLRFDFEGHSFKPVAVFQDPSDEQKITLPSKVTITYNPVDDKKCVIEGRAPKVVISGNNSMPVGNSFLVSNQVTCNQEPSPSMLCMEKMEFDGHSYEWQMPPPSGLQLSIL